MTQQENPTENCITAPCSVQSLLSVGHGNFKLYCSWMRTETASANDEHEVCDSSKSSLSEHSTGECHSHHWSPLLSPQELVQTSLVTQQHCPCTHVRWYIDIIGVPRIYINHMEASVGSKDNLQPLPLFYSEIHEQWLVLEICKRLL